MTPGWTPATGLPEAVLHIGTPKTGTSALQKVCHDHADALAAQGVHYPTRAGSHRHYKLSLFVTPADELEGIWRWRHGNFRDRETFRRTLRRKLGREVLASGCDRVLLSDEALYGKGPKQQRDLRRLLSRFSGSTRIVVYLRRQDDHLVTRYQQQVKQGLTQRLADYAALARDWPYDYFDQLAQWQRTFQPTEIVVRRYERDRFRNGSLYDDFFGVVGVDVDVVMDEGPGTANESLDAATVEFIRLLNIFQVEHQGEQAGAIDNRTWLERARSRVQRGPTLTLPDAELDDFMALWQRSNQRVATEFLGETGDLFTVPRSVRSSQTEQYLDRQSLQDFIELLEVPTGWRRDLLAIGEREARSVDQSS